MLKWPLPVHSKAPLALAYALCSFALFHEGVRAQNVASYTFASSTGTYVPITGGTVLVSGTNWNNQRFTVSLPAPFWFAGTSYSTMYVTANGFITFGSIMTASNFIPLSSVEGYAGAIAPFGANLQDANTASSEVRWQHVGDEIVVQWREAKRKIAGAESFSFQVRLNTVNSTIRFVYTAVTSISNSILRQPEVGLRGPNNTFATNVLNRTVGTGSETWGMPLTGSANTDKMRFTGSSPSQAPTDGLTYTFTPPCVVPASSATTIQCQGGWSSVTVTATNGRAPYSGTGTFLRQAGTHNFTVTDANGCSAVTTIAIGEPSAIAPGAVITTPIACNGGDATVSITAAGGTGPYTGIGTFQRPAGTHSFTVTDANGCSATTNVLISEPSPLLVNPLLIATETGCATNDAQVELLATGGTAPYTGNGLQTGLSAGDHTFVVSDANGCSASASTTVPMPDTDKDGVDDCTDECPDDPDKVLAGACGCGVVDSDSDSDGAMDCVDNCPGDPLKVNPGACGCGAAETDTDADSYADCVDQCPNDPLKIAPGSCGCGQADADTDGDGILDCVDPCPAGLNPGSSCDDGDATTINDTVDGSCTCQGTPVPESLVLSLTTDAYGAQISWEILPAGGGASICAGSGYANDTTVEIPCAASNGEYRLRVMDSFGDGLCCTHGPGGFVLRTSAGDRIIDAAEAGTFGSMAEVSQGFSLPMGEVRLTDARCDREDYLPNDFIQCTMDPAVCAEYGIGDQSDDGYQFWIFDPNGGYSRRIFIAHGTNNYFFPSGMARCTYLDFRSIVSQPPPHNELLNVRVRPKVNGVFGPFGPACRIKIDVNGLCPTTALVNNTMSDHHSCGLSDVPLDGSRTIYTEPISAANKYQFEFTEGAYVRRIASPTSSLVLANWSTSPLLPGHTYSVRVRASYDEGLTYCPFGAMCSISLSSMPLHQSIQQSAPLVSTREAGMVVHTDTENEIITIDLLGELDAETDLQVDLIDLQGRTVLTAENTVVDPNTPITIGVSTLKPGIYIVRGRSGEQVWSQRTFIP